MLKQKLDKHMERIAQVHGEISQLEAKNKKLELQTQSDSVVQAQALIAQAETQANAELLSLKVFWNRIA